MSQCEVTLACGGVLKEGGTFWAVSEEGVAEQHGPALILPPRSVFDDTEVAAGGVRFSLRDCYAGREDAIAGSIRRREEMNSFRREAIKKDEQALKRLYAQRDEIERFGARGGAA